MAARGTGPGLGCRMPVTGDRAAGAAMLRAMRRSGARLGLAIGLGGAVLVVAFLAGAQLPTIHEWVPDIEDSESSILVSSGGPEPDAFVYDGEMIPAPEGGGLGPEERRMDAIPG